MMPKNETDSNHIQNMPIAIIGMGCLFPRSPGLKAFWQLLSRGRDAIGDIPDTHWSTEAYFSQEPGKADLVYCRRGGFLPHIAFDPSEFGIPPATIEATDTSQLLALVTARDALLDAGYGHSGREFDRDRTSVVLGVTGTQEMVIPLGSRLGHPIWRDAMQKEGLDPGSVENIVQRIADAYVPWQENSFPGLLGNVVAGRICNRLDLGGTNCVVDAACASSMSAVHLAMLELQSGSSDMVVTGGVDTINDIFMHMCFSKTMILSKTGDIRPFSKDADGTVLGEGLGMLVLKSLDRAEQDGDNIYAVIKGMGSSSDGKSQSIYAPNAEGQAKALRRAYENAGVEPATVGLVEAHGTGTRVGDKVELNALKTAFGAIAGNSPIAVGSVKSMIGHTKAAAGAAGIIKAALALKNKVLPPTLKAVAPDPDLDIEDSPFFINSENRPWLAHREHPRRAGVSSFGFGGSNFHLVLEEYGSRKKDVSWDGSVEIFAFSAQNKDNLKKGLAEMQRRVDAGPVHRLDINRLAAATRNRFSANAPLRLAFVHELTADPAVDRDSLKAMLKQAAAAIDRPETSRKVHLEKQIFYMQGRCPGDLAFIFPGQGSQYQGMGRDLCAIFPEGLEALELADSLMDAGSAVSDAIFPRPFSRSQSKERQQLNRTDIAQPAIGSISLAMFDILGRFGLKPDAVCGHSYGELSALHAAGFIDRQTFMRLSAVRGKAMADAAGKGPEGTMLAVKAPLGTIENLIRNVPDVVLANFNSPEQAVLSGPIEGIERAEGRLREKGLHGMRLPVSAAFHSPLIQGGQHPFEQEVRRSQFVSGSIPVYANSTGRPYETTPEQAVKTLARQMVNPVRFTSMIENMHAAGIRTFVEVGPKSVLTDLVKTILSKKSFHAVAMDASGGRQYGLIDLACTLSTLAVTGCPVSLDAWEEKAAAPEKQRMTVMLSGANYRPEKPVDQTHGQSTVPPHPPLPSKKPVRTAAEGPPAVGQPVKPPQLKHSIFTGENAVPTASPAVTTNNRNPNKPSIPAMKNTDRNGIQTTPSTHVESALKTVTEGLRSMRALQARTAEAHQKFLETQAASGRTLQHMMESVQRLAEASLGIAAAQPGRPAATVPDAGSVHERPQVPPAPPAKIVEARRGHAPAAAPATESSASQIEPDHSISHNIRQSDQSDATSATLLNVVSDLTGYPVEMLNLDMDIEADLGIDSIKRVEILSTLEERLPDLPPMEPETMAALKTLGQIAAHIGGIASDAQPVYSSGDVLSRAGSAEFAAATEVTDISQTLIQVVSELTGYPREMLSMDMDVEADLGIDSIKRVEILSTLEERMPGLPEVTPDLMGSLKTLGQISAHLSESGDAGDEHRGEAPRVPTTGTDASGRSSGRSESAPPVNEQAQEAGPPESPAPALDWKTVTVENALRSQTRRLRFRPGRKLYLLDDGGPFAAALVASLGERGVAACVLSRDDAAALILDGQTLTDAAGLIIPAPERFENRADEDVFLKSAFQLAKSFAANPDRREKHRGDRGDDLLFATITRLDGAFGFAGREIDNPVMGGLAGLTKTAALEWHGVTCRALDIDPLWEDLSAIADRVAEELMEPTISGPLEIGLTSTQRRTPVLQNQPHEAIESEPSRLDLDAGDVIVVTGGARGVTAAAAEALAGRTGAAMALMGRSPQPAAEPAWLRGLDDTAAIKRAILENEFNNNGASPKEIEQSFVRHMASREVRATLEKLETLGTRAMYLSVDVREHDRVAEALETVRSSLGPVTAIVHGAGVIEDRLIVDKSPSQFDMVYGTKVSGLRNLLSCVKNDPLKHLVIFSSISARIGNAGQVDYAMANEALNKMAAAFSRQHPACRTLAVNWGPWDGGMVTPALRTAFKKQHVGLIPLKEGARSLVAAMGRSGNDPVEIVIGSSLPSRSIDVDAATAEGTPAGKAVPEDEPPMTLSFKKEIDTHDYPILTSHVIGGNPVVPFSLITEWFGHGALHENPGLVLHGLDDMRILKGVKLVDKKKLIRLFAGKTSRKNGHYEVSLELRDGMLEGKDVIHSRGKAILLDAMPEPPSVDLGRFLSEDGYHRSAGEVYEEILFHGIELRGIKEILSCSPRGMTARISSAPSPSRWIREHLRSGWIADPLVLDCAFQMATVWCYEETGQVSLPSYCASYRQYCETFPAKGVTAVLEVTDLTKHKMTGNFLLVDENKRLAAKMTGYEAVMDASLFKAFKPGR
ncbi:MAG: SDR family NAD(P)-dependent oxidoreductase [Deltaproteobacteria bacterium]|nr:SDR family NAD(P)-dependent oxidoreductase [Deltaproteobacteria bacterium]